MTVLSGGVSIVDVPHDTSMFPFCFTIDSPAQCGQAKRSFWNHFPGAAYSFCDPRRLACNDSPSNSPRGRFPAYESEQPSAAFLHCNADGDSVIIV